jgi:hypothetical protein
VSYRGRAGGPLDAQVSRPGKSLDNIDRIIPQNKPDTSRPCTLFHDGRLAAAGIYLTPCKCREHQIIPAPGDLSVFLPSPDNSGEALIYCRPDNSAGGRQLSGRRVAAGGRFQIIRPAWVGSFRPNPASLTPPLTHSRNLMFRMFRPHCKSQTAHSTSSATIEPCDSRAQQAWHT